MLFNSIDFAIFFPLVFILYWFIFNRSLKLQNVFIFIISYIFYGFWDWRFLSLIFFSTIVDYFISINLEKSLDKNKRALLLLTSILVNLGILAFFKYCNFFIENLVLLSSICGVDLNISSLNIILPVGISFYTFQTLSYSIDVYKKKIKPTKDFIAFASFVSFFPQLVAGPIERATNLLPQFYTKRIFKYKQAVEGMRQILWGLFKKIVIADNCAEFANLIFNDSSSYSGSTLLLGAFFFAFQIYGDFSGYSDIAIGISKLLGFDLKQNFAFPYFSRDVAEFWRRWHISLSTWFRDYVYIPLGGSRVSTPLKIRNIFVIFIVSGLWHGANWTFIIWGALNALYFLPLFLQKKNRNNLGIVAQDKVFPTFKESFSIITTFSLTLIAWVFFRASSIDHAVTYISEIFSPSLFTIPDFNGRVRALETVGLIVFFLIIEWSGRQGTFALEKLGLKWSSRKRLSFYLLLCITIFLFFGKEQEFIYFQF